MKEHCTMPRQYWRSPRGRWRRIILSSASRRCLDRSFSSLLVGGHELTIQKAVTQRAQAVKRDLDEGRDRIKEVEREVDRLQADHDRLFRQ